MVKTFLAQSSNAAYFAEYCVVQSTFRSDVHSRHAPLFHLDDQVRSWMAILAFCLDRWSGYYPWPINECCRHLSWTTYKRVSTFPQSRKPNGLQRCKRHWVSIILERRTGRLRSQSYEVGRGSSAHKIHICWLRRLDHQSRSERTGEREDGQVLLGSPSLQPNNNNNTLNATNASLQMVSRRLVGFDLPEGAAGETHGTSFARTSTQQQPGGPGTLRTSQQLTQSQQTMTTSNQKSSSLSAAPQLFSDWSGLGSSVIRVSPAASPESKAIQLPLEHPEDALHMKELRLGPGGLPYALAEDTFRNVAKPIGDNLRAVLAYHRAMYDAEKGHLLGLVVRAPPSPTPPGGSIVAGTAGAPVMGSSFRSTSLSVTPTGPLSPGRTSPRTSPRTPQCTSVRSSKVV